jgi:cell wall-associated NlpC family hydrolase/LysM repeat protein
LTIKKIALGACLLVAGISHAQDRIHTVSNGETVSGIASKYGATTKAILQANHLPSADKLKLGQKLTIPATAKKTTKTVSNGTAYTVQAGDTDVSIAKKLGVTAKELRVANMGANWTRLQIGQTLVVPGKTNWFEAIASHASRNAQVAANAPKASFKLVSSIKPKTVATKTVQRSYTVRKGDNDWIIAKRVGIKPSDLRKLNPGISWTKLQPGKVLKVPGTKVVLANGEPLEKSPNLPPLRSRYAVVTTNGVTARQGPSIRFKSVVQIDRGTRVLVLDHEGSWYKLRFPKGTEAWVRADYLAPTKAPQLFAKNKPAKKTTVVAAKTKKPTVTAKKSAPKVTLVAQRTNRSSKKPQQATRNTRSVAKSSGKPLAVSSKGNGGLIEKAQSFLGVRYRYGAASRSATDCSGFTSQVFKSQGVKLPRTAAQQSKKGQKVNKSELKPGDLVFFNTRGSRVSHVGIYKGNGKFIHASSGRGKVMESNLNEGYYQRRFAGARRVIASKPTSKKASAPKKESPKSEPSAPVTTPLEPPVSPPPA